MYINFVLHLTPARSRHERQAFSCARMPNILPTSQHVSSSQQGCNTHRPFGLLRSHGVLKLILAACAECKTSNALPLASTDIKLWMQALYSRKMLLIAFIWDTTWVLV